MEMQGKKYHKISSRVFELSSFGRFVLGGTVPCLSLPQPLVSMPETRAFICKTPMHRLVKGIRSLPIFSLFPRFTQWLSKQLKFASWRLYTIPYAVLEFHLIFFTIMKIIRIVIIIISIIATFLLDCPATFNYFGDDRGHRGRDEKSRIDNFIL